jgi:hypothetical protein
MGFVGYYSSAGFTSLSSIFNPSSATAYCGGWIQCGAFYHVCGTCPGQSTVCNSLIGCPDGSACPCGDVCYAIPMQHYMCSGASQATCGVSCSGGMCDTGYMSCSWTAGVTCPPGQSYCGSCINACRTTPPSCSVQIENECGSEIPPDTGGNPFCGCIGYDRSSHYAGAGSCIRTLDCGPPQTPGGSDYPWYCEYPPGFTCPSSGAVCGQYCNPADPYWGTCPGLADGSCVPGPNYCTAWHCEPVCEIQLSHPSLDLFVGGDPVTVQANIVDPKHHNGYDRITASVSNASSSVNPAFQPISGIGQVPFTVSPNFSGMSEITFGGYLTSWRGSELACTRTLPVSVHSISRTCAVSGINSNSGGSNTNIPLADVEAGNFSLSLSGSTNINKADPIDLWIMRADELSNSPPVSSPIQVGGTNYTPIGTRYATSGAGDSYYRYVPSWSFRPANWNASSSDGLQAVGSGIIRGFTAFVGNPGVDQSSQITQQHLVRGDNIHWRNLPSGSWNSTPYNAFNVNSSAPVGTTITAWSAFVNPINNRTTQYAVLSNNTLFTRNYNPTTSGWTAWVEMSNWLTGAGSGSVQAFDTFANPPTNSSGQTATIYQFIIRDNRMYTRQRIATDGSPWSTWVDLGHLTDNDMLHSALGESDLTNIRDISTHIRSQPDQFLRLQMVVDTLVYSIDNPLHGNCHPSLSTGQQVCSTSTTITDLPVGRYTAFCQMPNNPGRCSGNPLASWSRCASSDLDRFTFEVLPPPTFNISGNMLEVVDASSYVPDPGNFWPSPQVDHKPILVAPSLPHKVPTRTNMLSAKTKFCRLPNA